jgi:hypothetical protein
MLSRPPRAVLRSSPLSGQSPFTRAGVPVPAGPLRQSRHYIRSIGSHIVISIPSTSFDHLVGADEQSGRQFEVKCVSRLKVYDQFNGRLLDREFRSAKPT